MIVRTEKPTGLALAATVACSVLVAACAHAPRSATPAQQETIAWPPPPDQARIAFVRAWSVPADLGIRRGWLRQVARFVAGASEFEEMLRPMGVAASDDGLLAVADPDGPVLHVYDAVAGRYVRLARAGRTPFVSPMGVAIDTVGHVYVSDSALGAVFRVARNGRAAEVFVAPGRLARPTGLAYDPERRWLFVTDTAAHRVLALDAAGHEVLSLGRRGTAHGEFNFPVAVALAPGDRLVVSDSMNHRVQTFTRDGRFLGAFGAPGNGPGAFDKAKGVGVDAEGHIYVADALHDVVQVFDADGRLLTVVGGPGDGPGRFSMPSGLFVDARGRIFVADAANRRVQELRYLGAAGAGS